MTEHIVLVGMMGVGKTTIGTAVAARLGRRFVDSDQLVEDRTGRTVREIFETDGEPAYRVLETEALVEALADPDPLVIAAAGGVVLRAENRAAIVRSGAFVVWLTADPSVLAARVHVGDHRPLLGNDPEAALRRLLPERQHWYEEVADASVETDGVPLAETIADVLDVVHRAEARPSD